jgi:hypothetical protein
MRGGGAKGSPGSGHKNAVGCKKKRLIFGRLGQWVNTESTTS